MRSKQDSTKPDARNKQIMKGTNTAVYDTVHTMLIPMLTTGNIPEYTSFVFDEHECLKNTITHVRRDCPTLTQSKKMFLQLVSNLFDEITD